MLMFSEHSIGALKHSTNSCFTQTSSSVSNTCKTLLLASYWYIYLLHRPLHVQHTHLRSISWFVFNKIKFKALHTKMLNIIVILLRLHKRFSFLSFILCIYFIFEKKKEGLTTYSDDIFTCLVGPSFSLGGACHIRSDRMIAGKTMSRSQTITVIRDLSIQPGKHKSSNFRDMHQYKTFINNVFTYSSRNM